jgi:hypothetical protein
MRIAVALIALAACRSAPAPVRNNHTDAVREPSPVLGRGKAPWKTRHTRTSEPLPSQGVTGELRGTITGDKDHVPLEGVTVVASSVVLPTEQIAITDEKGAWSIANLPPGNYILTYYFGDNTLSSNEVVKRGQAVVGRLTDYPMDPLPRRLE